jgi:hypothetical protein
MKNVKKIEAMARKLREKTSILTDEEVALIEQELCLALGPDTLELVESLGLVVGDTVRWGSLRARCEEERETRGLTLKDISSDLKIPQYRLRAIEQGTLRELKTQFAHRYFHYLGIESWVKRWARANAELARRSGILPFPSRSGDR